MYVLPTTGLGTLHVYSSTIGTADNWRLLLNWPDKQITKTVELVNVALGDYWYAFTVEIVPEIDEDLSQAKFYAPTNGFVNATFQGETASVWTDRASDIVKITTVEPWTVSQT